MTHEEYIGLDFKAIHAGIDTLNPRNPWSWAVGKYAHELVDKLAEDVDYLVINDCKTNYSTIEAAMLNGARDWHQYSWGGCALCYNHDLARRLRPAMRNRFKALRKDVDWLDVQAKALEQAASLVAKLVHKQWDGWANSDELVTNMAGTMVSYEVAVMFMDDEIREQIHCAIAPCSNQEFFSAYEKAHMTKFGEPWVLSQSNPVY